MPAPLIVSALSLALLFAAGALQRKAAATMLSWWFWIGGIALWLYCLVVIDALLGVWWVVVGIMLFGVGVYPVALIAALIRGEWMIFGDVGVALVVLGFVRSRVHKEANRASVLARLDKLIAQTDPDEEKKSPQQTAKYLVKRPNETEGFSFVATLEKIKAGLKTGEIKPEWGVKKESDGAYDWITIDRLLCDPPRPKSPGASLAMRIIKWAAIVFVASCLFPPWLYTFDRNGPYGGHSRKPAGYNFIARPPSPEEPPRDSTTPELPDFGQDSYDDFVAKRYYGVQVDLPRLALEWAAIAAVTGVAWMLTVRPGQNSNVSEPTRAPAAPQARE